MPASLITLKTALPDLDLNPGRRDPSACRPSRHCGLLWCLARYATTTGLWLRQSPTRQLWWTRWYRADIMPSTSLTFSPMNCSTCDKNCIIIRSETLISWTAFQYTAGWDRTQQWDNRPAADSSGGPLSSGRPWWLLHRVDVLNSLSLYMGLWIFTKTCTASV